MSFRLFIYYCAVCGGWAAFLGWMVGHAVSPENALGRDGIRGMMLGLFVALGIGLVDSIWNLGSRIGILLAHVCVAVLVGAVGGLLGGVVGHVLFDLTQQNSVFLVIGWTLTGLLIGASVATFEILAGLVSGTNLTGAVRKLLKCLLGGTLGGLIGGVLALVLLLMWGGIFGGKDTTALWSPTAMGFVALGMCIGLLVGLAQVILKQAWIKVEAGFRSGREMILAKELTSIGRAEGCDIALFGDPGVEKQHAVILLDRGHYYLDTVASATLINDRPVAGRVPLRSGDQIRLGKSMLRFYEKQRRAE